MSKNKIMEEAPEIESFIKVDGEKISTTDAKEKFKEMMETYKKQNPEKFALKEKSLLVKLNTL